VSDVLSGTSDHDGAPALAGGTAATHTLRSCALKIGDVVVMALASSGPTQSIAVTLAALLAFCSDRSARGGITS